MGGATVLEDIETINAPLHLRTGYRQGLLELRVLNADWIASAFQDAQCF